MTEKLQLYRCNICNNLVEVLIEGKGELNFVSGLQLQTEVGYDSVRRNVAKALSGAEAEAE